MVVQVSTLTREFKTSSDLSELYATGSEAISLLTKEIYIQPLLSG